jgi:hypothetical protein
MDRARSQHSLLLARLLAVAAAAFLVVALLGVSAGSVLAGPESGVDVVVHEGDSETTAAGDPPTACTFHLHFQADTAISGAFQIRAGDEGGVAVAEGLFDTESGDSRAPASGVYELDEGIYVVTWDDEVEQDRSFDEQAIEVDCGEELPAESGGGGLPAESGGEELPAEGGGGEAPGGGELGIVGTPQPTLPATDTAAPIAPRTDLRPTLGLLALVAGIALLLTPRVRLAHRRSSPTERR